MNYNEARNYVKEANKLGSVLGLDNIKELLNRLGNPERKLNIVHFAGTNGKGSTICFVEKALLLAGYKVGKYTSPAVFDYLEIIRIDGENIREKHYSKCVEEIKFAIEGMLADGFAHPTAFEIETALAFLAFNKNQCDIVLLETGMGGLTDATNVIEKNICSVITSISMDHMNFLGDTVEKITRVKSGIIKKECPVVKLTQKKEVMEVVESVADEMKAPFFATGTAYNVKNKAEGLGLIFDYESKFITEKQIEVGMAGKYQIDNAVTAMETIRILENNGYAGVMSKMREALITAVLPGRFEIISKDPMIIIDGAHNPDAAIRLRDTLQMYFTNKKIAFIMGVLADKDFEQVAQTVIPYGVYVATVTPNNPRALDGKVLAECVKGYCENVYVASNIEDALLHTFKKVRDNEADMIVAFGSLSYLSEVKEKIKEIC